jgi:hypothetical protein
MAGLLLLVLVAACVFAASRAISRSYHNGDEWQDVLGMTPCEVRQVLGEPLMIEKTATNTQTWIYQAGFGVMGVPFKDGAAQGGWSD